MCKKKFKVLLGVILAILLIKSVSAEELQSAFDENFKAETEYVDSLYINNYLNNMNKLGYEIEVLEQTNAFAGLQYKLQIKDFEKYEIYLYDNIGELVSKDAKATIMLNANALQFNDKFKDLIKDSIIAIHGSLSNENEKLVSDYFSTDFSNDNFEVINKETGEGYTKLSYEHYTHSDTYSLFVNGNVPVIKPEYKEIPYQELLQNYQKNTGKRIKVKGRVVEFKDDTAFKYYIVTANENEKYRINFSPKIIDGTLELGEIIEFKGMTDLDVYEDGIPSITAYEIIRK